MSPIIVLDIKHLGTLLEKNEIDPPTFCNLNNFVCNYVMNNMLVPGQVDRWITIVNLN